MSKKENIALFDAEEQKVKALYGDLLEMNHHVSTVHRAMGRVERAAQFGAFAALTGHYDALAERARHTEAERTVEKDVRDILDLKLRDLKRDGMVSSLLRITYFKPDERKDGGAYVTQITVVKRWDDVEAVMIIENGDRIPYAYVMDVEEVE